MKIDPKLVKMINCVLGITEHHCCFLTSESLVIYSRKSETVQILPRENNLPRFLIPSPEAYSKFAAELAEWRSVLMVSLNFPADIISLVLDYLIE